MFVTVEPAWVASLTHRFNGSYRDRRAGSNRDVIVDAAKDPEYPVPPLRRLRDIDGDGAAKAVRRTDEPFGGATG